MANFHWISQPSGRTNVTVVFMHGIDGHALRTWTPKGSSEPWIGWLLDDFAEIGLATVSYSATVSRLFGQGLSLSEYGRLIEPEVSGAMQQTGGKFVFVCHSLGGLIYKKMAVMAASDLEGDAFWKGYPERVVGVVFYSTPHDGSHFGTLSDKFRLLTWPTATIQYLSKGSNELADLSVAYRNTVQSTLIPHRVFYETKGTPLGFVVSRSSADPGLPGPGSIGIPNSTHSSVCKPSDPNQPAYRNLVRFLEDEVGLKTQKNSRSNNIEWPRVTDSVKVRFSEIALRLIVSLVVIAVVARGVWTFVVQDIPEVARLVMEMGAPLEVAEQVAERVDESLLEPRNLEAIRTAVATNNLNTSSIDKDPETLSAVFIAELERVDRTYDAIDSARSSGDVEVQSFLARSRDELEAGNLRQAELTALAASFRDKVISESGARLAGGEVRYFPGWLEREVTIVRIPQLSSQGLLQSPGRVSFYSGGHDQIRSAFQELEESELMDRITRWCGSLATRTIQGTQIVSTHALGISFDINCDELAWGQSLALESDPEFAMLVDVFERHGFIWGGRFAFPDPMHFQMFREGLGSD